MANLLDSIARGPEGRALVEFAKRNNLALDDPNDWVEDKVKGFASGCRLDNLGGTSFVSTDGSASDELLLHLSSPGIKCVVNVSLMLAMAVAFCAERQANARRLLKLLKRPRKKSTSKTTRSRQPKRKVS